MASKSIECDIINASDGRKLRMLRLSLVPQSGDELDLDLGAHQSGNLYRIVQVRYHVRPRKLAGARWAFRTDDLIGMSLYVTPAPARA